MTIFVAYSSQEERGGAPIARPDFESRSRGNASGAARIAALTVVAVLATACSTPPSEAEAIERLAATEAAAQPILAAAIGIEAVWERSEVPQGASLLCGRCVGMVSQMRLGGDYTADVLDLVGAAAMDAGARSSRIYTSTGHTTRDGTTVTEILGWSRFIAFEPPLYDVRVGVNAETGEFYAHIYTSDYLPASDR